MPKRKTKPAPQPAGDFTDQIRAGDGFTDARVVMMPGETKREALNTRRRQCPAMRWDWLSAEQRAMLVLFAQAADDAGYGRVRSALCDPHGDGADTGQERQFAKRQRYAAMRNACRDQVAMLFTTEALDPPDRETFDATAARLMAAVQGRDKRRVLAMWRVRATADDLLAWKRAGERMAA